MNRFTSVLALVLAVATLVAFMTAFAIPSRGTISEAAMTGPIFQPDLWKVY